MARIITKTIGFVNKDLEGELLDENKYADLRGYTNPLAPPSDKRSNEQSDKDKKSRRSPFAETDHDHNIVEWTIVK